MVSEQMPTFYSYDIPLTIIQSFTEDSHETLCYHWTQRCMLKEGKEMFPQDKYTTDARTPSKGTCLVFSHDS